MHEIDELLKMLAEKVDEMYALAKNPPEYPQEVLADIARRAIEQGGAVGPVSRSSLTHQAHGARILYLVAVDFCARIGTKPGQPKT